MFKVYFWWRIGNPEFNYFITPGDYVSKSGVYIFSKSGDQGERPSELKRGGKRNFSLVYIDAKW